MGKNWKGPGGSGRGGRGGRGGGGSSNDTSSCKGHGAIMGTCDAARERETSKEMVNLLNQAIEYLHPVPPVAADDEEQEPWVGSVKDMLAQEISQVRKQKHSATQNVMSVDTKVKGIVMIKIMRKDLCALELVKAIFDRVKREKEPCSRHVVRIIPLQRVFFPDNNHLSDNIASIVLSAYPGAALPLYVREIVPEPVEKVRGNKRLISELSADETADVPEPDADAKTDSAPADETTELKPEECGPSASKCPRFESPTSSNILDMKPDEVPQTTVTVESCPTEKTKVDANIPEPAVFYAPQFYSCIFKARSHNIMTRETVQATVSKTLPLFLKPNFKKAKVSAILCTSVSTRKLNLARSP
jgi:hypothetical protein